tara:strand:+ start:139 stop:444 length:306 start_codon:yes stop_codon:yes gene_type:complete
MQFQQIIKFKIMIKYIVTGGAGFIGSYIVEFLVKKNKKIIVLDNLSTGRVENINRFKKKINWRPKIKIEKGIKILFDNINYWKKSTCLDTKKDQYSNKTLV